MFAKLSAADGQAARARRAVVEVIPPAKAPKVPAGQFAKVAFNAEMLDAAAGPGRSTRHIGFDLPAEGMGYAPGDHLAVHPVNPDKLVEGICGHLGLPRDGWFRILGASVPLLDRYRDGYPVGKLLAEDLDLVLPDAPEELFAAMRAASRDPDDQMQLDRWIATLNLDEADPARVQLRTWLRDTYYTLLDLFDAFPQSVPPIDVLIELLPRQKPRMYSIASSGRVHPKQARIMAGVLTLPARDGRPRRGLCSHYLKDLKPGERVRVSVKRAPKALPDAYAGPLLMVGAGTGLAPLYGVLQDRAARGAAATEAAPVALYAGFRSEAEFLMRDDLIGWRRGGYLTRLTVAFSRMGPSKAYVQDALDGDGPLVWDILRRPDAHMAVCGDAKMAQDVEERLLQTLQAAGGLSYAGALDHLRRMKAEGRMVEDVWGVQLNRDVALPEMVRAKYDAGAGWLSRLQRALTGRRPDQEAIRRY
jgi:sulfite reductase alpha subunit-like flavoprotein